MPILNTNQLLPGGLTPNLDLPYVVSTVGDKPTAAVNSTTTTQVDFTAGKIFFDGIPFAVNNLTLNLASLGSLVSNGQRFLVALVPTYVEPTTTSAAITAGVNYTVSYNDKGEALARLFIDPAVKAQADSFGGFATLQQKVLDGIASQAEQAAFYSYSVAQEKLADPRYMTTVLTPTGLGLILIEIQPQQNYYNENVLLTKTEGEFNQLFSRINSPLVERKIMTTAEAATRYNSKLFVVKSAKGYTSLANAQNDTGGTNLTPPNWTAASSTHVAVNEYFMTSAISYGHRGNKPKVLRYITKEDSLNLTGRIKPLYLEADYARSRFAPISVLTKEPDILPLVDVTMGATLTINEHLNTVPA